MRLSTRCVDRAVPIWGKPEDGNASDKTPQTTCYQRWLSSAQAMAWPWGLYLHCGCRLVTEDNLTALGDTWFITRLPATSRSVDG